MFNGHVKWRTGFLRPSNHALVKSYDEFRVNQPKVSTLLNCQLQDLRVERKSGSEGSERLPNRIEQREDDREHVAGNVSGSSSKFNRLKQYGVFGRDPKVPSALRHFASASSPPTFSRQH